MKNTPPASLILCPGFLGMASSFESVIKELSLEHLKPYVFDVETLKEKSASKSACLSLNLERILSLPKPRVVLGYSMGGRIALMLEDLCMEQHGETLFDVLHLYACHPGLTTQQEREERSRIDEEWSQRFETLAPELVLDKWNAQAIFKNLAPLTETAYHGQHAANVLRGFSLANQKNYRELLKSRETDCTYYYGETDLKYAALAKEFSQLMPKLQLKMIPNRGHRVL